MRTRVWSFEIVITASQPMVWTARMADRHAVDGIHCRPYWRVSSATLERVSNLINKADRIKLCTFEKILAVEGFFSDKSNL